MTLLLNLMEELSPRRQLEATPGFSTEEMNSPKSILYVTADFNIQSLAEGSGSSQFNLDLHCSHAARLLYDILLETTEAGIIHCIKSKVTTAGSWWCETGHIAESLSSIYWLSNCESLVFVSVNELGVALQRGGSNRDEVLQMGYFCFPAWEVVIIKRPLSQADIEAYALLREALFVYLSMTCFKKHLIISSFILVISMRLMRTLI